MTQIKVFYYYYFHSHFFPFVFQIRDNIGYPVAECAADGKFVLSKPPNTGGLVSPSSVSEQVRFLQLIQQQQQKQTLLANKHKNTTLESLQLASSYSSQTQGKKKKYLQKLRRCSIERELRNLKSSLQLRFSVPSIIHIITITSN